jgi:hypothetical protein
MKDVSTMYPRKMYKTFVDVEFIKQKLNLLNKSEKSFSQYNLFCMYTGLKPSDAKSLNIFKNIPVENREEFLRAVSLNRISKYVIPLYTDTDTVKK